MYDASGAEPDGEWFELYNKASSARSLAGLTLVDGGNRTHTIKSGTEIVDRALRFIALPREASPGGYETNLVIAAPIAPAAGLARRRRNIFRP